MDFIDLEIYKNEIRTSKNDPFNNKTSKIQLLNTFLSIKYYFYFCVLFPYFLKKMPSAFFAFYHFFFLGSPIAEKKPLLVNLT